ncbi:hypothetical protein CLAFUW4_09818 [Fulvia fulva]|uniref:Uncharacterized protein n=1 Tax=Passalora fulva TaxID=5499 RepID=A0A9Q8PIL4_PASFU|nr:uncharacterized protein CLAFUR5_12420 [Fulvia fulva]KAK4616165.1 hypothetical protein CLAFUR4_09824 [Fulvia fulva]KAK4616721.1 hypothetical protein CLAFUR0_09817 [Fulvia fulva]UJO23060.1 hypothetical protein CLAFUR5_12420 [Fulvia fulva]WPV18847.1 hypothetical protein CLAFUW4_09818 [Fulvia fulva]WPV34374.1 hypothetical protein CLAFUW7_09821 [Fulvia fulva]
MLRILSKPDKRLGGVARLRQFFSDDVSNEERAGLRGLSYDLVHRMTGGRPNIVLVRAHGSNTAEGGFTSFPNNWATRLRLLFDWDDNFLRDTWEHRPWRRWVRYYFDAIESLSQQHPESVWPADLGLQFKKNVGRYASNWIRILPAYDKTKIHQAVRQKKRSSDDTGPPQYQVKWISTLPLEASIHIQNSTAPKQWSLITDKAARSRLQRMHE